MDTYNGILKGEFVEQKYDNVYQIFIDNFSDAAEASRLIETNGKKVTYFEIKKLVDSLSSIFLNIGLKKGSEVGIFIGNSIIRIATILALSKLGVILYRWKRHKRF